MNAVQEFISITPWTIVFQICNLLILVALIRKFLWKRVMAVIEARQKELEGIHSAADKDREDAAQLMLAGATAVAVGTSLFADPYAAIKVRDELAALADKQGLACVSELTGGVRPW